MVIAHSYRVAGTDLHAYLSTLYGVSTQYAVLRTE